jgi:hypothetical protein
MIRVDRAYQGTSCPAVEQEPYLSATWIGQQCSAPDLPAHWQVMSALAPSSETTDRRAPVNWMGKSSRSVAR